MVSNTEIHVMQEDAKPIKILTWCSFAADRLDEALRDDRRVRLERISSLTEFRQHISDADAAFVIGVEGFYDEAVAGAIRTAPKRFRWLQNMTAGYDGLLKHGVRKETSVTLARGSNAISVAEHGFALLLGLTRALPTIIDSQRRRSWSHDVIPKLGSLEGKTLCVLGLGAIGKEIARLACAFGMTVVGVARSVRTVPNVAQIFEPGQITTALSVADVVCIALPLTEQTHHLVGKKELDALGPQGHLINIGRGPVVDCIELDLALRDGRIAGAALDVTDPEPLPSEHPLWLAPNTIISPHIGGYGSEKSFDRLVELVVSNTDRFIKGEELLHRIQL